MNAHTVLHSLIVNLRVHARKNHFTKTVLGLSGGIDSALTACIAVQALGKKNVTALIMPGPFTVPENIADAKQLCKNLSIPYKVYSITKLFQTYCTEIDFLSSNTISLARQNLQARIRANLLMSYSNQHHALVLNTGNKSECLTGYFTLYGDSCGGLAVLGSLYKTQVYEIAWQYNFEHNFLIPLSVFEKAPTAELRKNQTDESDLLQYPVLDEILKLCHDRHKTISQIVKLGFNKKDVRKVVSLVKNSKFKRTQLPPVLENG